MTAKHVWNNKNDFSYCTLDGCRIVDNAVTLDYSKSSPGDLDVDVRFYGTILSDIKDSSVRIDHYDELIPKIEIPVGTSVIFYVRTGVYKDYTPDTWTDWYPLAASSSIVEYTLSLSNNRIMTDYDIEQLVNIYYSTDEEFYRLASMLNPAFLNSIDENDTETIEQYELLWTSLVDVARAGLAKVDYDPGEASPYAKTAGFYDNQVILLNTFPDGNVPVVVEYLSRNFVLNGDSKRYIQWKCEFVSDEMGLSPILREFRIDYTLDFYKQMINEFPQLFRRI